MPKHRVLTLWAAIFFGVGIEIAAANTWTRHGVQTGAISTAEECEKYGHTAVWLVVDGRGDCIRYFHAGLKTTNPLAHIWFHGDRMHLSSRQVSPSYRLESAELQQEAADSQYRAYKLPFVMLSRPGVYGSSGYHVDRRLPRNTNLMVLAVKEIVQRHAIDRLAVSGQSGGGHLVAALLTARRDIRCAVITSGVVAVRSRRWFLGFRPLQYPAYDPIDHVKDIPVDPKRRIFMLADPEDRKVPFASQVEYYRAVKKLGHRIWLIDTIAPDDDRHGLTGPGHYAVYQCVKGESIDAIRQSFPASE